MNRRPVSPQGNAGVNRRAAILLVALTAILLVLLLLSPQEATLGRVVKLVYLHGAMVRTAILLFLVALPCHLAAMAAGKRGAAAWGNALTDAGIVVWMIHTVLSIVTTYATWGVLVAWSEPRTRFTFAVAGFSLLVAAAVRLLHGERLAHLPPAILSAAILTFIPRLGFLQHPIDPIGRSTSPEIRLFYTAILAVAGAMGAVLAWRLRRR